MTFPELGALEWTDRQVLGFKYQYSEDTDFKGSFTDYMGTILLAIADSYADRHVGSVVNTRVQDEVKKELAKNPGAKSITLTVDIDIPDPPVKP